MSSTPTSELDPFGGKPAGRPTVLEALGLTVEDIVKAYKANGTLPKTAAATGISERTLKKYLKLAKASGAPGGRIQPFPWRQGRPNPATAWFKEHRNDKLPRSAAEIAALSGLTKDQVQQFLFRRRKAAEAYLRALGDLRELPGSLVDIHGRKIPFGMIQDYVLKVDRYDLTIRVVGALRLGMAFSALYSFPHYQALFGGGGGAAKGQP